MKNRLINYIKNHLLKIAICMLIFGIIIILIFIFIKPFNDWSFKTNPELFGLYGDFIGGFVGTLFSLVAVFLLYKTLITQQETIKLQANAIELQKKTSEIERFETTFFNLLKTQQEITNNIKAYFSTLNIKSTPSLTVNTYIVQGREFFGYSKDELTKIWKSIESNTYLGSFDEEDFDNYIKAEIEQINEQEHEIQKIINEESIRFANKEYSISNNLWEQTNKKEIRKKLEIMYGLFFQRYHYAIGHYYRHLYHIIDFVEQFEKSKRTDFIPKKYIDFIQAQMSSFEMMLLFYNAISFPKLLKLLIKYNFLENLAVEDLIHISHNCIKGINLKKRETLLGN
jgi:hypothetical protein